MKRGCWVCKGISLVLALALAGVGYIFVVKGNVEPHADGRTVVLLSADERNMVLGEMRGLLEAVQAVVQAATKGDMAEVSTAARAVGMVAAEGESAAMLGKIPLDFMKLGMGTHKAFDALAETADSTDDPLVVLGELGSLMDRCTSCHAGYRFGIEGEDREN
mgnify:CR=1 FL=1